MKGIFVVVVGGSIYIEKYAKKILSCAQQMKKLFAFYMWGNHIAQINPCLGGAGVLVGEGNFLGRFRNVCNVRWDFCIGSLKNNLKIKI